VAQLLVLSVNLKTYGPNVIIWGFFIIFAARKQSC